MTSVGDDDLGGLAVLGLDRDEIEALSNLAPDEFAEYLHLMEQALEGTWLLTPKQELTEILWRKVDWMLYGGSAAGGKELALSTRVPTPSGWKLMGDLQVGDELFTEKGETCRVLQLHPVDYEPNSYRVTFSDGQVIYADANHRWWTYTDSDSEFGNVRSTLQIFFSSQHHMIPMPSGEVVTIDAVEPCEPMPMRCITVSNPTGIFLIENFIPTHNSEFACWHADQLSRSIPGHVTLILRQSIPELRRSLILRLIARVKQFRLPCRLRKVDGQTGFHYDNGSLIECGYLATDEHLGNYLSAEYDCVDENTVVLMGDGSWRHIRNIRAGDMVGTLEGPRLVSWCGPVGDRQAVTMTPEGRPSVTASLTHPILGARGWVSPLDAMETSAWSADGRNGSAASDDGRRVKPPLPEWTVPATLFGPPPLSGSAFGSERDLVHALAGGRAGSSTAGSPASCMTGRDSDGGPSRPAGVAGPTCTPSPDDAAAFDADPSLLGGQVRIPTRSHEATGTYRHPYTMEDRPLVAAVHQASVRVVQAGVRAMWDMTVQGANHYVSSSGIIHRNCVMIDEATQLTPDQIVGIAGRLRTTKKKAAMGARPHLGMFTNPGDVSHAWMYDLIVVPTMYGARVVVYNIANGIENRVIARTYDAPVATRDATLDEIEDVLIPWARDLQVEVDPQTELAVAFIPSKATDNPHIDASYLKFLNALPERRRRQLRDGDWDVFEGQFFHEWDRNVHVIAPFDIPESWPRARGVDYGSTNPWACLWGAWDNDGNCYVYREAYAAMLTPEMQARQAKELSVVRRLDGTSFTEKYERTVADPSVFSEHRRGHGRSVAQMWAAEGFHVTKARNDRVAGWANVRQYLWDPQGGDEGKGAPRLYVFETCHNLARTVPLMRYDRLNGEDLDSRSEDHACLSPWTKVTTRKGSVPISVVTPGDEVWTRFGWRRVLLAGVTGRRWLWEVRMAERPPVLCSGDHLFWTTQRGWVAAVDLLATDSLLDESGTQVEVVEVVETDALSDVWNLLVAGDPEFFAGGVLVHNCDALRYLLATRPIGERPRRHKTGQSIDQRFQQMMSRASKRKRGPSWT